MELMLLTSLVSERRTEWVLKRVRSMQFSCGALLRELE